MVQNKKIVEIIGLIKGWQAKAKTMIRNEKTAELIRIMELVRDYDPRTWRREYPPKIIYKDKRVSLDLVRKHLKKVFSDRTQKIGTYFHIPFCKSRCGFCEFYSEIPRGRAIDNYLSLLNKELELYGIDFKENPIDNLYLGGGTPSFLSEKQIATFFKIAHRHFKINSSTSVLTEGTPDTSTLPKLKLFKELGVERYTIGAQCFDNRVLRLSGRLHSTKDIYKAFSNARRAGIKYINLDILIGLHGETERTYRATMQGILDLKPDCVSFMIFDQGRSVNTGYTKKARNSYLWTASLRPVIFAYLNSIMAASSYIKPEGFAGSIYVLRGKEESVNKNILNRNHSNPTIGFGVSAESSFLDLKYFNADSLKDYTNNIVSNGTLNYRGIKLNTEDAMRRYVIYQYGIFGLLDKKNFQLRFKKKFSSIFRSIFHALMDSDQFIDIKESIIFSPDIALKAACSNYLSKNHHYDSGNQEHTFISCLKYFYSSKIISELKRLIF